MEPTVLTPEQEQQKQQLLLQYPGVDPAVIDQMLSLGLTDPSGMSKQYDQSSYVRRAATSGDYAKSGAGVLAQGLAGMMAGKADKDYASALRTHAGKVKSAKTTLFDQMFPREDEYGY